MLQLILKFALKNGLKAAGGFLMAHGWATQDQWTGVAGLVTTMAGLGWDWYQSHSHAVASGAVPPPALPPKMGAVQLVLLSLIPALAFTGCALPKDVAHVYHLSGDGTSVGITQNPATQAYELGLKRVHTTMTIVPVIWSTNQTGSLVAIVPDSVVSDEINARNGIFGGAGGTITVAVGSNAVQSTLGGQHVPINEGTGNNLPK